MRSRALVTLAAAATAAVAAASIPGAAAGAKHRSLPTRHLWATINACDTVARPDTLGIRGSMPGTRSGKEEMFMRFQAQYRSADDGKWHSVTQGGDSGFVDVGRATHARQRGWNFRITPSGDSVVLRGTVTFEWRLHGEVDHHARRLTHRGHRSNAGADPAGYSATTCTVTK